MSARVMQGNVFELLPTLPRGSVDCVVTSPPYWNLRSYLPPGHALKSLELGSEPTVAEYISNQVRVMSLVRECLADHGTVWLNIGDSYSHGSRGGETGGKHVNWHGNGQMSARRTQPIKDVPEGNLCLIPQRLTIALQEDGWFMRSIIVWRKPAPMPISVFGWRWQRCRVKVKAQVRSGSKASSNREMRPNLVNARGAGVPSATKNAEWRDCAGCRKCEPNGGYVLRRGKWRPTSSWEPIIMLAKSARYYCDGDAVKTPPAEATTSRDQYSRVIDDPDEQFAVKHDHETICDGANIRDVWSIPAEPLREKHYAAFPTKLVETCLRAGTSAHGYCAKCGSPWCRVVEHKSVPHPSPRSSGRAAIDTKGGNQANGSAGMAPEVETVGWRASCKCGAETRPGLVLDPFTGSGRTGIAAGRLGLDFVGCELNPDYHAMATRLLRDESPLFA